MDIWKWIYDLQTALREQGSTRLSELIRILPGHVCGNRHALADALFPEALYLSREMENPWLEIFFRHWRLQSQIFHRYNVSDMLQEAVELVEFAHRDGNRECPQSVCAVQDLCHCYALMDGPAYVTERLAVLDETLSRITPSWDCFFCLTGEYTSALLDASRYEESLDFLRRQETALVQNRKAWPYRIYGDFTEVMIEMKQYDQALEYLRKYGKYYSSESDRLQSRLRRARIFAGQGDFERAEAALPSFEEIEGLARHYKEWAGVRFQTAYGGFMPYDWRTARIFRRMSDQLSRRGVIRHAITIADWQARLALKTGGISSARRCCARIESLMRRLRNPSAPEILQMIEDLGSPLSQVENRLPSSGEEFQNPQAILAEYGDDPDAGLEILESALQKWPDHPELAIAGADAHDIMGNREKALNILRHYLEKHPGSPDLVLKFIRWSLETGDSLPLIPFARAMLERGIDAETRKLWRWFLVLILEKTGNREASAAFLTAVFNEDLPSAFSDKMARILEDNGNDLNSVCALCLDELKRKLDKTSDPAHFFRDVDRHLSECISYANIDLLLEDLMDADETLPDLDLEWDEEDSLELDLDLDDGTDPAPEI
jgi:tetratricopeptide (TPR) repeat protein